MLTSGVQPEPIKAESPLRVWLDGVSIVAWHFLVLPLTWAVLDWLAFSSGPPAGGTAPPPPFDLGRIARMLPAVFPLLLAGLIFEGLLAWLAFRVVTRRRSPGWPVFVALWWWTCIGGTVPIALATFGAAAEGSSRPAGMLIPLVWFAVAPAGPVLLALARGLHHYPTGHCQRCGYDLTGNISGRCPECGEELPR